MVDRLNEVLTIAQVARLAGWYCKSASAPADCRCTECTNGTRRMLRHLLTQDRQLGGMLLTKTGCGARVRYLVTLQAIEQIHPEWFAKASTLGARIDELEAQNEDLRELVKSAHEDIGTLRRRIEILESMRRAG